MTINEPPVVNNYYQEQYTHYYNPYPYVYQPWVYPRRNGKKTITERFYDTQGRLTKEVVTETDMAEPWFGWSCNSDSVINVNIPNVEANTAQAVIDNINNHTRYSQ